MRAVEQKSRSKNTPPGPRLCLVCSVANKQANERTSKRMSELTLAPTHRRAVAVWFARYLGIVRNKILIDLQGDDVLMQIFTSNVLQRQVYLARAISSHSSMLPSDLQSLLFRSFRFSPTQPPLNHHATTTQPPRTTHPLPLTHYH